VITRRRFAEVRWLGAFFLDILAGLSTLKLFGRSARSRSTHSGRSAGSTADTTMEVPAHRLPGPRSCSSGGRPSRVALVAVEISLR
jgi:hypothetical protein